MATCVDLAGATYPTTHDGSSILPMEGRSLLPAFEGKPINRVDALYWEHEGNRAMRDGKWKLVAKYPAGKWELYDIDADRTEMHDLASAEPERTRAMAEKWEAWGRRDDVLPWPWKPQYSLARTLSGGAADSGKHDVFELKQGDDLQGDEVPQVANKSVSIEAKISKAADDGVVIAQGGLAEGYSLYIKSDHADFAIRRRNTLTVIADRDPLPAVPFTLSASLARDGTITLMVNGATVASGKAGGPLVKTPVDGLQVGEDLNDPVGSYKTPFTFKGEIDHVTIRLKD